MRQFDGEILDKVKRVASVMLPLLTMIGYIIVFINSNTNLFLNLLYSTIISVLAIITILVYFKIINNRISVFLTTISVIITIMTGYIEFFHQPNIALQVSKDMVTLNIIILAVAFILKRKYTIVFALTNIAFFITLTIISGNKELVEISGNILLFFASTSVFYIILFELIERYIQKNIEHQKEIEKLSKFKENIVRLMFHDLKVPLNSVLEISKNSSTESEQKIRYYANNMKRQLEDVLEIDKLETPEYIFSKTQSEVSDLLEKSVINVKVLAEKKGIKIIQELYCSGTINCNYQLIQRTIVNLLSNAIKYSPEKTIVKIEVRSDKNNCIILVKDNGKGIKPEYHNKIFEKFFILNKESDRSFKSHGLGLSFCRLAVEAHDGEIKVLSSDEKGTIFVIKLPDANLTKIPMQQINTEQEKLYLSNKSKSELENLCLDIKQIPIYKIGEIIPKTKAFENSDSLEINNWIEKLTDSVYEGNKQAFDKLINMVL